MDLLDVLVIGAVLIGTVGTVVARLLAAYLEFRVQRRVARLLERNAELLEREGMSPTIRHR